jgi:hypothetical protein
MTESVCAYCSESFEAPTIATTRLLVMRAESGYLVLGGPEYIVHRCDSLTRSDAAELLRDAQFLYNE